MAVCVLTTSPANQSAAAINLRLAFLQALTDLVIRQMSARQTPFRSHSNLTVTLRVPAASSTLSMATAPATAPATALATATRIAKKPMQIRLTV